jgi:hypothetical protein
MFPHPLLGRLGKETCLRTQQLTAEEASEHGSLTLRRPLVVVEPIQNKPLIQMLAVFGNIFHPIGLESEIPIASFAFETDDPIISLIYNPCELTRTETTRVGTTRGECEGPLDGSSLRKTLITLRKCANGLVSRGLRISQYGIVARVNES